MGYIRNRNIKEYRGMGLIEVIVAMGVLVIIGLALINLVLQAVTAANSAKMRALGTKYAEEGMEIVRSVRGQQTNWGSFSASCIANINHYYITSSAGSDCSSIIMPCPFSPLGCPKIGSSFPGSAFTRKIDFIWPNAGQATVTVTVEWLDRGKAREVVLKSELTKWK